MTLLLRLGCGACLLVGALLTALRLLQPEAGVAVRLVSFAPWAVGAYLAALLALGLLVLVRRRHAAPTGSRAGRGRVALATVPACLGLVLHLAWLAPLHTGGGPAPGEPRLTVMTLNLLLGEADPAAVVGLVEAEGVDLLAVQEVTPDALMRLEELGLNEHLPFHAGTPLYGVEGTMLYSRHPLAGERDVPTRWTSFRVRALVQGREVGVVVTHPESPMGDAQGWRGDHRVLREAVVARPPDLLVGDLNATADHEVFRRLLEPGLRDAAELAGSGWQPTWPAPGTRGRGPLDVPPVVAIDHVLVGEGWTATRTEVHWVPGTDHAALVAEVAEVAEVAGAAGVAGGDGR